MNKIQKFNQLKLINIQKMLALFVILTLVMSTNIATSNTSEHNKTNITNSTNGTENINISDTGTATNGNSNVASNDMPADANTTNIIPLLLEDITPYTNPVTGISIFNKKFRNVRYDSNEAEFGNLTFYLPITSYVHIDVSATMQGIESYAHYRIDVDSEPWFGNMFHCILPVRCDFDIQKSRIYYLNRGYHTLELTGRSELNDTYDGYSVEGYISVITFPEYTAITVASPNGGENWAKGTTKTITWRKDGNPGLNVKIELYKGTVLSNVISSRTSNDGSYSWYIPTYQPIGTDYKIKITSYEEPTKYSDWSNNNFRIY